MHPQTANQMVMTPGAMVTVPVTGKRLGSLAAWYGEPLAAADAERLRAGAEKALRYRLCTGQPVFQVHVQQLLARYWAGASISIEYQQLAAFACGKPDLALLEIIYGQLLMSRRHWPAMQHLDRGFNLAAAYLEATDYFLLVRRHELLRLLPLSQVPLAPQGLQSLLVEAAVIRQLQGTARPTCSPAHQDTIG
jgi:hypothetical protein